MTTRKALPAAKPALGPTRDVPTCGQCGHTGGPSDVESPYIACVRGDVKDPTRHTRQPVHNQPGRTTQPIARRT